MPANLLQAQVGVTFVRDIHLINLRQRDYFGAHTFRVQPGKENAKLKKGEDIRTLPTLPHTIHALTLLLRLQLDRSWRECVF